MRLKRAVLAVAVLLGVALGVHGARAVEAINVRIDASAIDMTDAIERPKSEGDRIQVSTAPGADGIIRRIEVRAREAGNNWAVFALANNSDEQIDRLIVVPHYRMVGSGLFWPDLGLSRIVNVTPSSGDRPDRQANAAADIYRITLDPGTVITYVVELRSDKLPQLYLWEPDAYKDKINSFTLYHGIVIGIAGLLALFLTILFVVKGSVMFPAAAALGWAVLAYIGTDFGFWGKVFDLSADAERVWRASGEAILAATLVVFLFAYLNLNRWHVRYAHITALWLVFLGALTAIAVFNPAVASGVARISLAIVATAGLGLVVYLAAHGFDRAVLLIPTWLLLVVWVFAGYLAVTGVITNDIVGPALLGGLVLIVMLIGFTVMQHAFSGGAAIAIVSDIERRALALTGAGDMIWDWDVPNDRVFTSPETEAMLGLKRGALGGSAADWLEVLHPLDRDRFRAALDGVLDQRRGRLFLEFRLRTLDGHYMWFALKARPGGRLRWRGGAPRRHRHRRDRVQDRRGAAAARCRARQPDRPAEPRAVPRPARCRALLRQGGLDHPPDRDGDRSRPLQAGERLGRHRGRQLDPAHACAPPRAYPETAGHAGAALGRPVRPAAALRARAAAHYRRSPIRSASRCVRRSPSTIARSCSRRRSGSRSPTARRSARKTS